MQHNISDKTLDEMTERVLNETNPPGTHPRQILFGLRETAALLGMSPTHLHGLIDRHNIKVSRLGVRRKSISAREIARLQIKLQAEEEVAA